MKIKYIILTILVTLTSIFGLSDSVQATQYESDTLVKTADNPIVYYIASDGQKYAFPDEATYRSWYPGPANLQVISNTEMIKIPSAKAKITVRPGARLVKFINSPKVYVVKPGAFLYWLKNEKSAEWYYGTNWKQDIVNVDLKQFEDYTFQTYVFDYSLDVNGVFSKTQTVNSVYNVDDELKNRKLIAGKYFNLAGSNTINYTGNTAELPVLKSMTENLQANFQPAFNYTVTRYTLTAQYSENTLNLKPITVNNQAIIYVNDTPVEHNALIKLDLRIGLNKFEIKVKVPSGKSLTYYVEITRELSNGNTNLSSFSENLKANLSPNFSATTYEYDIYAEYNEATVKISATAGDKRSTVQINPPGKTPSYQQTEEILLDYGTNIVTVQVRAENGNTKIYKYIITRRQYPKMDTTTSNSGSSSTTSATTSTACIRNALTGTPSDPCRKNLK